MSESTIILCVERKLISHTNITIMLDPRKQVKVGFNLDEHSSQETLEFLLYISAVCILIVVSPALFLATNSYLILSAALFAGLTDLAMSQIIPERMDFDQEDQD